MTVVEQRRLAQRMHALGLANGVRAEQATLRHQIRRLPSSEGARFAADVIERGEYGAMRLRWVLGAIRRVGDTRVQKWCRHPTVNCSVDRRIDQLTPRQRRMLVILLEQYAGTREKAGR